MKVCFLGAGLAFLGGQYHYVLDLASKIMEQGHEVTVATRSRERRLWTIDGVKYEAIMVEREENPVSLNLVFPLRCLSYFLHHRDFDLIHSMASFHRFAPVARLAGIVAGAPVIYEAKSPASPLLRLLGFAKLICSSRNVKQRLGGDHIIIPHFVNLERFKTTSQYDFRKQGSFVVGTMGAPVPRRGFEYFVKAIPFILERYPDTLFVLAIDLKQAEYEPIERKHLQKLKKLIKQLNLSQNVKVIGEVDAATFFNSVDVFVSPFQTTKGTVDIPATVLECLAGGCALVSSSVGGIPEVVDNYENGILINRQDRDSPRAYASKVLELMEDRVLLEKIKSNARRSVEAYDIDEVLPQILNVYEEVLKGAKQSVLEKPMPDKHTREFYRKEQVAKDYERTRYLSKKGKAADVLQKRAVLSLLDPLEIRGKRVLDVGCGSGRFTRLFAELGAKLVIGVDSSRSMISVAREADKVASYIEADTICLPFDNNSFDLAVCIDTINHLSSYQRAVHEICRVSKKVVLGVPNQHSLISLAYVYKFIKRSPSQYGTLYVKGYGQAHPPYTRHFSAGELEELLRGNGMDNIRVTSCLFFVFLPNVATSLFQLIDTLLVPLFRRFGSFVVASGERQGQIMC